MKEIYFDLEAREKLFLGVQKLHDVVSKTLGPNGKTVVIPSKLKFGEYIITKDGVSVAEQVQLKDPIENIGCNMVKEVALKTADEAGDGTTTSIVLANAFIQNLKDFEFNDINKSFNEIIPKVLEQLKLNSRVLKQDDIKHVASISANNDLQIGELVQQAYDFSNLVKVEESTNSIDKLDTISGMSLNVSYFSKLFVTDAKKAVCELSNPAVILIDGVLDNIKSFGKLLNNFAEKGKPILIIAEDVHPGVLRLLETNVLSFGIKLCVIKTPGFGPTRKDYLRDLSDFTEATIITDLTKEITEKSLGKLESCNISKNKSLLIKHQDINIDEILNNLNSFLKLKELEQYEKDILLKRIEMLSAKVSIIKVGGGSELEMKERFDRYDDAIKAVQCALEEGIVEGAGYALNKAKEDLTGNILKYGSDSIDYCLYESLSSPLKQIVQNGAILYATDNMFKLNIIDPLKVTRCALENAVSIAKTMLSTDAVVLNEKEWN